VVTLCCMFLYYHVKCGFKLQVNILCWSDCYWEVCFISVNVCITMSYCVDHFWLLNSVFLDNRWPYVINHLLSHMFFLSSPTKAVPDLREGKLGSCPGLPQLGRPCADPRGGAPGARPPFSLEGIFLTLDAVCMEP